MLEKRTVLSQIEVPVGGAIQVRLEKQVVEDGVVLAKEYHRTVIEPGTEPEDQMAAVNEHLKTMGCAPVSGEDIARIRKLVAAAR